MHQQVAVKRNCSPHARFQVVPAVAFRQVVRFPAGLFAHFLKARGEFIDVVLIGDAAVARIVAILPQFGDQTLFIEDPIKQSGPYRGRKKKKLLGNIHKIIQVASRRQ